MRAGSVPLAALAAAACLALAPGTAAAEPPQPVDLSGGAWEVLERGAWNPIRVPGVFQPGALPSQRRGGVRVYKLHFIGPVTPPGFRWLLRFEGVRRRATVFLNGRPIGRGTDGYTPFSVEARGLNPGGPNDLVVPVNNRRGILREGWWNWGGIVRPVWLVPAGPAYLSNLGLMSRVRCPAGRCRAHLLIDGTLERGDGAAGPAVLGVRLRSPGGRVTEGTFPLGAKATGRQLRLSLPVPSPELWSPRHPALYAAELTLRVGGEVVQRESRAVGLRSVGVRSGLLYLNGRRVDLRGASIHEDMPGSGAGLSSADTARIVADLQAVGANVTRAHYLLSDELLSRLDRAGILVWSEAPIWQRDQPRDLLRTPAERRSALITVRRTVLAARSHPSVITHSVANELTLRPDERPSTRSFLVAAAHAARRLDPTLPISVDVKSHLGVARQSTYRAFDMLGINEYFGWYPWVPRLSGLVPYLRRMRGLYPRQALVVTEFGVEAPPRLAGASAKRRGSYAFQARYLQRTLSVLDRQRFLSGAIYWTLREFQIQPHWRGGLRSLPRSIDNTLNHKGLLTYDGVRKPAWYVARRSFARVGRP